MNEMPTVEVLREWSGTPDFPDAYNMKQVRNRLGRIADEIERLRAVVDAALQWKSKLINGHGTAAQYLAAHEAYDRFHSAMDKFLSETTKGKNFSASICADAGHVFVAPGKPCIFCDAPQTGKDTRECGVCGVPEGGLHSEGCEFFGHVDDKPLPQRG